MVAGKNMRTAKAWKSLRTMMRLSLNLEEKGTMPWVKIRRRMIQYKHILNRLASSRKKLTSLHGWS